MDISGYKWDKPGQTCAHDYLMPTLLSELKIFIEQREASVSSSSLNAFDLGCGNGSVAGHLFELGGLCLEWIPQFKA